MSIFTQAFIAPIRLYQRTISANTAPRCRYAPSCSHYAIQALDTHGVIKGTLLSVWRVLRCNPWSKGGVDRVPEKGKWPRKPLNHTELMALYEEEDRQAKASKSSSHARHPKKKTRRR